MSRTRKQKFSNKYPTHPVPAWAYIDNENQVIQVKNIGEELDPEEKGLQIPFGATKGEKTDSLTLVLLEATFFKYYYNNVTKFNARTSEYRSRKNDKIAVFENGKKSITTTAENAPTFDEGKAMTTGMKLYVYHPASDLVFCLQLKGLDRGVFFTFRNQYAKDNDGENYPVFYLNDMVEPTQEQREGGAAKHWRYPVFVASSADSVTLDRADAVCESLDAYFDEHPDFWNPEEEAEKVEAKVITDNSEREAADNQLQEDILKLPTHEGETPNIDDVPVDGIFENSEIPPVTK